MKYPPYILFDTIKANLFPGQKRTSLYMGIINKRYSLFSKDLGIDGAYRYGACSP